MFVSKHNIFVSSVMQGQYWGFANCLARRSSSGFGHFRKIVSWRHFCKSSNTGPIKTTWGHMETLTQQFCWQVTWPCSNYLFYVWKYLWGKSVGHCKKQWTLSWNQNQHKLWWDLWWWNMLWDVSIVFLIDAYISSCVCSHVGELYCVHWAANQTGSAEVHAVQNPGKELS